MRMMRDFRQPRDLLPEIERLVIVDIDGGREFILRQAELFGHQIPGELDGAVLEVVAEREIAEHLEKRVMPRGIADIVEIIVLAAGAHAFLRGGGALIGTFLDTGKDVLELNHAGIGEHQRRVVTRHQRRRRHDLVAVLRKIIQECRPDLVNATHVRPIANCRESVGNPVISSSFGAQPRLVLGATGRKTGLHFCWPRPAAPLLDKRTSAVQKVCSGSGTCRSSVKSL